MKKTILILFFILLYPSYCLPASDSFVISSFNITGNILTISSLTDSYFTDNEIVTNILITAYVNKSQIDIQYDIDNIITSVFINSDLSVTFTDFYKSISLWIGSLACFSLILGIKIGDS